MSSKILFIDFDGTITSEETLDAAIGMCLPREMVLDGLKRLQSGGWTLGEAVSFAFEQIPSSRLADIIEYVRTVPVRPGFDELLGSMKDMGIPVVVISGGLKPYVDEKMAPYIHNILDVYSLDVDISGPFIKLSSDFTGKTDLMDKPSVMKQYSQDIAICVGDGYSDIEMAMASQKVFARGVLAGELKKKGIPFTEWEDFHDVKKAMGHNGDVSIMSCKT